MSYSDARNHFEKARMNTADAVTIEMLDGLKHLSHAIEEDIRKLDTRHPVGERATHILVNRQSPSATSETGQPFENKSVAKPMTTAHVVQTPASHCTCL